MCSQRRALPLPSNTALPSGFQDLGRTKRPELPLLDFDLEAPPELGPEVNHFLKESGWQLRGR